MAVIRLLLVAATLLVGGCGGERQTSAKLPRSSLTGVYAGTFPCQNCPGIQVTLWLRSDGRFFLKQRYIDDSDSGEAASFSLGRWRRIPESLELELQGSGPGRVFTYADRDTLVMRTGSDLEHRLSRQSAEPAFSGTLTLEGMMDATGGGASFTECLTGFTAPVAENRELMRFQQQYRHVDARGKPVFVEFEGRFTWSMDGSLQSFEIKRFNSVKEGRGC